MGKPNFEQKASRDSDKKFKQPKNPLFVYQTVARIISAALRQEGSLRKLVYENATSLVKTHLSLAIGVARHRTVLESLVNETGLAEKEDISPELAQVLVYELLLGARGELPEGIEIFDRVSAYRDQLEAALSRLQDSGEFNKLVIKEVQAVIPRYGRVNTLLTTLENVVADLQKHGFTLLDLEGKSYEEFLESISALKDKEFVLDFHFPQDLLVFNPKQFLAKLQVYRAGHLVLHDKTSYFPVACLGAPPGSVVLDACAAPGMKTVHLAARMNNQGELYSFDPHKERLNSLCEIVEYTGVTCCRWKCQDFMEVNPLKEPYSNVEYLLLDPPCTGSGIVNRLDFLTDTTESKSSDRVWKLSGLQFKMLCHAAKFSKVKRIVYSTCSVEVQENEQIIKDFLDKNPGVFQVVNALPEWPTRANSDFEFGELCVRASPENDLTNGFFVAVLERNSSSSATEMVPTDYGLKSTSVQSNVKSKPKPGVSDKKKNLENSVRGVENAKLRKRIKDRLRKDRKKKMKRSQKEQESRGAGLLDASMDKRLSGSTKTSGNGLKRRKELGRVTGSIKDAVENTMENADMPIIPQKEELSRDSPETSIVKKKNKKNKRLMKDEKEKKTGCLILAVTTKSNVSDDGQEKEKRRSKHDTANAQKGTEVTKNFDETDPSASVNMTGNEGETVTKVKKKKKKKSKHSAQEDDKNRSTDQFRESITEQVDYTHVNSASSDKVSGDITVEGETEQVTSKKIKKKKKKHGDQIDNNKGEKSFDNSYFGEPELTAASVENVSKRKKKRTKKHDSKVDNVEHNKTGNNESVLILENEPEPEISVISLDSSVVEESPKKKRKRKGKNETHSSICNASVDENDEKASVCDKNIPESSDTIVHRHKKQKKVLSESCPEGTGKRKSEETEHDLEFGKINELQRTTKKSKKKSKLRV